MSYRSASTRKLTSYVDVPVNRRLERVMEVGKLLRGLQLRSDFVATGADGVVSDGPKRQAVSDSGQVIRTIDDLPHELKTILVHQSLMSGELPWRRVNKEFKVISDTLGLGYTLGLGWGDAYTVLTYRYPGANEVTLKTIASRLFETIDFDSKIFPFEEITKIAVHYSLSLSPFYETTDNAQTIADLTYLRLKYIPDDAPRLIYNTSGGLSSGNALGVSLEDVKSIVFTVCNGALEKLEELRFNGATSNIGVTTFFSSISNSALPELGQVHIQNNKLGNEGMRVISMALESKKLPRLRTLIINENEFDDVGMGFFSSAISNRAAESLRRLMITGNQIGTKGMVTFSTALAHGALASLETLVIGGTQIGGSGMIAFADAITPTDETPTGALASLKILNLANNQIGDSGTIAFSSALSSGGLPKLQYLDLKGNQIGDSGMKRLCNALYTGFTPTNDTGSPVFLQLKELILDGNPIGTLAIKQLLFTLLNRPLGTPNTRIATTPLSRIRIWSNDLMRIVRQIKKDWQYTSKEDLYTYFVRVHSIVKGRPSGNASYIDLQDMAIAVDPAYEDNIVTATDLAYHMLKMCAYHSLTLHPFDLAPLQIDRTRSLHLIPLERDTDQTIDKLCFALHCGALAFLQQLDLSNNHIDEYQMKTFSSVLSIGLLSRLTKLMLFTNQIGNTGAIAFADAIKPTDEFPMGALGALTQLKLSGNEIGGEGIKAFSSALSSGALASLELLYLSWNQIGDTGMTAFSTALSKGALPNLVDLQLSYDQIGDTGMIDFAGAIKPTDESRIGPLASLQTLWLDHNNIGDAGMIAFAGALKPNSNFSTGSLPNLKKVVIFEGQDHYHPSVVDACELRGIIWY